MEAFNKHAGELCISSITMAELMHGIEKSERLEQNLRRVEAFESRLEVVAYGDKAASHYGNIRADLERRGCVIGVNDLHIAGHARSEGLRLENWIA